jgi:alpha-D-ribose 1-methylphosphonate 5-triphosphate synthase subunit PhnI
MYVAAKGGEAAIAAAHQLLARERRGDQNLPELSADQIREQLALAVNRVMCEGSLYDGDLAAVAIKQARGDLIEAIFLLRAYRATLPRLGYAEPVDTGAMRLRRLLGPTFDYTHRLLDPSPTLAAPPLQHWSEEPAGEPAPPVTQLLDREGLIETNAGADGDAIGDLTRTPLAFPAGRGLRLQALARADEGFLLGLAYSTQRGYGRTHPFAAEIRMGEVELEFTPEELGFAVPLGQITLTDVRW